MNQVSVDEKQPSVSDDLGDLERGRALYGQRTWAEAYDALARADRIKPLSADDLEMLATSAYMVARDEDYLRTLNRAYQARLNAGQNTQAARCAYWLGWRQVFRGETGGANAWFARVKRLVEVQSGDCVEQGYLLTVEGEQHLRAGDVAAACTALMNAVAIGDRFGDADLIAIARMEHGRGVIQQGETETGLDLLDEVMLAATAGTLSPMVTGLMYCAVIDVCRQIYAVDRAREWTVALDQWCQAQPEMISFTGKCLAHRAEIMQLQGTWPAALAEAQRCCERFLNGAGAQRADVGYSYYRQGEIYRLTGEYRQAEDAYRNASQWGWEPQPGLALLRLAQGRTRTAIQSMDRLVKSTTNALRRAELQSAQVDILLGAGRAGDAREACDELTVTAKRFRAGLLGAVADYADGAVGVAEGDAFAALESLRSAFQAWQEADAPYLVARTRVLIGVACRVLGDDEGASLELEAARSVFERLGAAPDLALIKSLLTPAGEDQPGGLTTRQLMVLRLIATGKTNKEIAGELFVSERTIDRHVSNILAKLALPSRAAATAYAYENGLI